VLVEFISSGSVLDSISSQEAIGLKRRLFEYSTGPSYYDKLEGIVVGGSKHDGVRYETSDLRREY
jgi:hypothetical protein